MKLTLSQNPKRKEVSYILQLTVWYLYFGKSAQAT
jgi:hypothetical protein